MTFQSTKSLTKFDYVFIALVTALWVYVYVGFFFPGSYIMSYGSNPKKILWFLRVALPLLYLGAILLFINFRLKKIDIGAIVLLFITSSLSLYVCYGIADSLYQTWFDSHRPTYHPYLQLMPTDVALPDRPSSNTITVFCLGGSTTEFTDGNGKDWPSRVEAILQKKYGVQNIKIYNLGRRWYTSLHTLINFETNLRKHKPSVVLIMQSINDLLQNADFSYFSRGAFREDYGHFYGPVNRIIDRRSLWHYLCDVVSGSWYGTLRQAVTTNHFPGLHAYERNINTIIELAKHDSITVVLMTEPYLIKKTMSEEELSVVGMVKVEAINDTMVWSTETVRVGMEQYNDALNNIALQNNLLLIDLEKEVPKSLTYFRDDVHYRDTTFSIIVSFVAEKLYPLLSSGSIK